MLCQRPPPHLGSALVRHFCLAQCGKTSMTFARPGGPEPRAGPCFKHSAGEAEAAERPTFSGARPVSGSVAAKVFDVLITVTNAVMRTAADGRAQRHDDLVRRRCIKDRELDGEVVRAHAFV